jgi:two-component system chemotaxis sensor kinase CheA
MNEFLEQFLIESRELLTQANHDLLAVENAPDDKELIDLAFRGFHTLKGGAGIVGFAAMVKALHAAEDVLSSLRAGARTATPKLISACLACLDQVQVWMDQIEKSGDLPSATAAAAAAEKILTLFADLSLDVPSDKESSGNAATSLPISLPAYATRILGEQRQLLSTLVVDGRAGLWSSVATVVINVLRSVGRRDSAAQVERAKASVLEEGNAGPLLDVIDKALAVLPAYEKTAPAGVQDLSPRTFRVDAERVDALVNLMGELIVAKNAVGHLANVAQDSSSPLADAVRNQYMLFERLVGELQHAVLGMRVLPLRHLFQRFERLVREMAVALGKPVRLLTEGDDTEADKAIAEELYQPILHIIRNAMDHGIESPAERSKAEKEPTATITLRAWREGEHVIVEVADDGGGVDIARVKTVAIERGVATSESLAALNESEIVNLIFEPGFTTASVVTAHSGRGVGMDAVRTSLERIGGRVTIETSSKGTVVRLTLPFSIMMTHLMTVESAGQAFGIPLDVIVETVRVPRHQIQNIGAGQAIVHRGRTIPVIDLAQTVATEQPGALQKHDSAEATLVIVSAAGQVGALEVGRLGVKAEAMLKPMPGLLSGVAGVSGTTLLGDGKVLVVLNIHALFS